MTIQPFTSPWDAAGVSQQEYLVDNSGGAIGFGDFGGPDGYDGPLVG